MSKHSLVCLTALLTISGALFFFISSPHKSITETLVDSPQVAEDTHHCEDGCSTLGDPKETIAKSISPSKRDSPAPSAAFISFNDWLRTTTDQQEIDAKSLKQGIELAKRRAETMKNLMLSDPERALQESLDWAEYKALPDAVKALVETPFSALGNYSVLPICNAENKLSTHAVYELKIGDTNYTNNPFGRRADMETKDNTAVQGIQLGDLTVTRNEPLQALSLRESLAIASDFPIANGDPAFDFTTGEPIVGAPTVALGGGKLFYFANYDSLKMTNEFLTELDEYSGPAAGYATFLMAFNADGQNPTSEDWPAIQNDAMLQASAWTETKKTVYFIRVDFPNNTGESTSQAALANVLNTAVSDTILDMSYGKTWIEAEVSPMVVRLPSQTTTYLPSNNDLLHSDAKAAFDALNTGVDLNSYDIIGVHFKSIGMSSGSITYAGLAGGGRQWLQGTNSQNVIIHEFGHNYGLGHASFWDTGASSVVGAGSNDEYGNGFDIMGNGPDPEGHFHPQAKAKVNWLETSDWVDTAIGGSATHRLFRGDNENTTGIRGIRIPKDVGINHYYWVGYRPAFTAKPYLQTGVVVNWEKDGRSWLIDTTPGSTPGKEDSGVTIGRTYSDTTAGIHITPIDKGGTTPNEWVDVTVNIGTFTGNVAPTATLTGPASGDARTALQFSISANDGNSDTLAYSWDFGDGPVVNNLNTVSHSWTLGGTYTVRVTVTDMKGGTVTKTKSVTVSDPLNQWNIGSVGQTATMSEAEYLNGRYILTGNQYAYFSLDGVNWTRQYLSPNFRAGGIAYGDGKYVITGADWNGSQFYATAYHSNDGKRWSIATLPAGNWMRDVAYGNGRFVAVGDNGDNMSSTDGGVTWTSGSSTGSISLKSISFANGEFLAVGGVKVYASSDGVTWADRSGATGLESWHSFDVITYANGKFFAGGWYSGIKYSSDQGVTWQTAATPSDNNYDLNAIDFNGSVFLASAKRKPDNVDVMLASADGLVWQESTPTNFSPTNDLTFGNGIYLSTQGSAGQTQFTDPFFPANNQPTASISGSTSVNARKVVQFTSSSADIDGDSLILIWDFQDGTDLVNGPSAYHNFLTGGTYNVKLTAVDGKGGHVTDTLVVTVSDPLNNWTQRTSGTTANLYDIATDGTRLVAVGSNNGTYRWSDNASSWSGGTVGSNIYLYGIIYDGSKYVAVGTDYDFTSPGSWKGLILTSTNGTSWTRVMDRVGSELRDIAYHNGSYVAVGDSGTIWRSTNSAVTWTPIASSVTTNLQGVDYGDGTFVIVGSNSSSLGATILQSTDEGDSWTNTSGGAGTGQGFFHSAYLNDRFYASGFYTRLRYSTNGGTSYTDSGEGNIRIPAMAYGNGIYFGAGFDYDNSDAKVNILSMDGENWSNLTVPTSTNRNAGIFYQNTFITVGNSGEIWQSDLIPAQSGWLVWQTEQFPGYPALSGPDEDYDGDGIANVFEFIAGTIPTNAGSYQPLVPVEESGYLTLTANKSGDTSGVLLEIEACDDLFSWDSEHVVIMTDNSTMLKARLDRTMNDPTAPRMFLRAKATVTP